MEEILNFKEEPRIVESIEKYEFYQYLPDTTASLNVSGEIRINIETQDRFFHPCESYLKFEGRLTKETGVTYADADAVSLINNGIMYLFNSISYLIGSHEMECLRDPGQATTMLGLLKYSDDFAKAQGLNQLWSKDTAATAVLADNEGFKTRHSYIIMSPETKGTFSFSVPLKHIFGFCEDYNKIVYGMEHSLSLNRKLETDAIFRHTDADVGKVTLSKISWFMPQVKPALAEKLSLYKSIESKVSLPVAYRKRQCEKIVVPQTSEFSWRLGVKTGFTKPRWIVVGFQTEKMNSQTKNPAVFDHLNVKNIYVMLNAERYPAIDYNLSFANQQFSRVYRDTALFGVKYFGMDELITRSNISPSDYKSLYPLFVFDVSKQSEQLKTSVVDVNIYASFNQAVPAGTYAYAVVMSDTLLTFQSDGNKMYVVY